MLFALSTASCGVRNVSTESTGPKISSCAMRWLAETPVKIVGGNQKPRAGSSQGGDQRCAPSASPASLSSRIAQEEIFGPVLSVLTFRTPEEALEKANNTPYGLSAGVWTEKGSRILWMADQLKAGVVWANTFNRFDPTSPFGGYKESGYGREGGRHGLEAYVTTAPSTLTGAAR